jgi:hypothetical protein
MTISFLLGLGAGAHWLYERAFDSPPQPHTMSSSVNLITAQISFLVSPPNSGSHWYTIPVSKYWNNANVKSEITERDPDDKAELTPKL